MSTTVTDVAPPPAPSGAGAPDAPARPGRPRAADERPLVGVLYASVWLLFLESTVVAAGRLLPGWRGWLGLLAVVGFAAAYLVAFLASRRRRRAGAATSPREAAVSLLPLVALAALLCVVVGQDGTATFVFLAVASVLVLPRPGAVAAVLGLALLNEVTPLVVAGWQRQSSLTLAVVLAAFAMTGVLQVIARNRQLVEAQERNARLLVEGERTRFARDLHDVLGHSLTVVTAKAELARRLVHVDPERAEAELADLERLSRDALVDVRRAVEGYRDLTLPGELARARQALETARIHAELPGSTEMVPTAVRELFAWAVREGVTNVIRHSRARSCRVVIAPDRLEVVDDGPGPLVTTGGLEEVGGHGLLGLRERAAPLGGSVVTETLDPGFRLAVVVP